MKKTLLIIGIFLLVNSLQAQELLTFTDVVKVDSTSQATLYNRAKVWINDAYRKSNVVIQLDDKDNGLIIIKAITLYEPEKTNYKSAEGKVSYTFKLYIKDNKYKYEISNFYHEAFSSQHGPYHFKTLYKTDVSPVSPSVFKSWNNKVYVDIKTQVISSIEILIRSLNKAMSIKEEIEKDW